MTNKVVNNATEVDFKCEICEQKFTDKQEAFLHARKLKHCVSGTEKFSYKLDCLEIQSQDRENPDLTPKQFKLLGSALGVNVYHAQNSKNKKDKVLPKQFYRNQYCAELLIFTTNETILSLVQLKLMIQGTQRTDGGTSAFYHCTDKGIQAFQKHFNETIGR